MDATDHCVSLVRARDLDRYLATLYAPPAKRLGLFALHALDLEIVEVARTTTEPMLGQIRLAWWREQLQALDRGVRPSQPVLAAVAEHVLPAGVKGASLEPLEDAGLALLDDDLAAYAAARATLFERAATLLDPSADTDLIGRARAAGHGWSVVELARSGRAIEPAALAAAERRLEVGRARPAVRSVFALAALARDDVSALRHGKAPGVRGAPGRQARLLWSMVTGR